MSFSEKRRLQELAGMRLFHAEYLYDVSGQLYIGVTINEKYIKKFLDKLKNKIGQKEFIFVTSKQQERDHGKYHLTVVAGPEMKKATNVDELPSGEIEFLGVGEANDGENKAYYVICDFEEGQNFREEIDLDRKDFHITIGFNNQDIHGISKNKKSKI